MLNLSGGVSIHSFQFNSGATPNAEQHSRGSSVKWLEMEGVSTKYELTFRIAESNINGGEEGLLG